MTEHKLLDATADVLPVGLQPTPFGEVWQALQQVAAQVWDVDPSVYRAGIAWMWYALRNPEALASDGLRPLLVAALISEQAPLVKDWQTNVELVEYLRIWRTYSPTYAKLEAIFSTFGARVEVRPISDAESQGVAPVADRRLAFYLRVEDFDAARPLTLDEVYQIAVRATPLGSRPVPYYALVGSSDVFAGPASAGLVRALWASEPASAPPMSFVVVDSATGAIVHGFNQELTTYELPAVILNSEDGYETCELPSVALPTPNVVIGVPITGPVQAFWFTDEGRDETSDKTFTAVGNPLFDEDGSVARNELYDNAVPLSFMQHDGNMFEADSESDIVRYLPVTDRLVLSIPGDSTTRGKSAWSVQVAKLFVLSYVNTQLPDVQIELPINEVGAYGTSITLPTIDGEYESGGKTWKPSAWDIGAFGSSYSLTGDVVAHLVFTEVVQYTEITLYGNVSSAIACQNNVTSGFTGNVNAANVLQLYTDNTYTTPWNGYDYSNDYEMGVYSSGVWYSRGGTIADLPATTANPGNGETVSKLFILLDTGCLWFVCNNSNSGYGYTNQHAYFYGTITLRVYPKGQQYYAAYAYGANSYSNVSIAQSTSKQCVSKPGSTEYIQTPHQFPVITLQKILGAAGNELPLSQYFTYVGYDGTKFRIINRTTSSNVRTVVYTLQYPTFYHWLKSDGTNINTSSGVAYPLMSIGGEIVEIDDAFDYFPIGLIQYNGNYATATYSYLNKATMGAFDTNNPTRLCFKQVSGTLSLSYVQYYKAPKSIRTTFGAAVTIPAGFKPVAVKCLKLFIKASSITKESGSTAPINFEYAGLENEFCADTDKALFGVGVNPCINMYGFSNASNFSLFMLSTDSSQTGSSYATSVSASKFNEDGYFVKGIATLKSNYNADTYAGYLQANPMMFVKYNQGVGLPFYFTIQRSMWSYENGVFSWLGNDTDTTDLAYWYKSAPDVQIILEKLPTT